MGRLFGIIAALLAVLAIIWACCGNRVWLPAGEDTEVITFIDAPTQPQQPSQPQGIDPALLAVGELVCLDSGIAGLRVYNNASIPVLRAEVALWQGERQLRFAVGYIPAFSSAMVEEKYQETFESALVSRVQIVELVGMERWEDNKILVEESGIFELQISNLTQQMLKDVRIFYKAYDPQKQCYIGGVTYCLVLTQLLPQESRLVSPYLYVQDQMKVVAVQIGQ